MLNQISTKVWKTSQSMTNKHDLLTQILKISSNIGPRRVSEVDREPFLNKCMGSKLHKHRTNTKY